ncbi:hypothetical protein CDAR_480711 [Caerostris darwini]|uniref:Uncharacterized protein n=1 Tax=Caerostris darwini TaxID=1538125 RepID=A0AAV4S2U4_9ARAC|nr:hypothetical protein CDAR_480711 [Caerostris darwini]
MNWKLCKNLKTLALADPSTYHRNSRNNASGIKTKEIHTTPSVLFEMDNTCMRYQHETLLTINRRAEVFPLTLLHIMRHNRIRHFVVYSFDRCVSKESQPIHRSSRLSTLSV